jgi:hypothetical protein
MARGLALFLGALLGLSLAASAPAQPTAPAKKAGYDIGVYYYPGWKTDEAAKPALRPWEKIKAFPEREPLLGWYDEGDVGVMEQHLKWMHDYGIDFVVFDWYWTSKAARLEHALAAYFQAPNRNLVKFSLLWANHDVSPKTEADFTQMVQYWTRYYFKNEQYQRIDGKPVVHVFDPKNLESKAAAFGSTATELIAKANAIARDAGYPGIYFVGGTPARAPFIDQEAKASGYDALSSYNYGLGHSFQERDQGYRKQWNTILKDANLPYIPVMTSGWDRRAWGGTKDAQRDQAFSTPDSFEAHLRAARQVMDSHPEKTQRMGVICCWNEFGEGSYIEPTKRFQFEYLERVKKVFGRD